MLRFIRRICAAIGRPYYEEQQALAFQRKHGRNPFKDIRDGIDNAHRLAYRYGLSDLSDGAKAYNIAAQRNYITRLTFDIRLKGQDLACNAIDKEDFLTQWRLFRETTLAAVPQEYQLVVFSIFEDNTEAFWALHGKK